MPLDALLEATASKEPVPGGGGIAAMTQLRRRPSSRWWQT